MLLEVHDLHVKAGGDEIIRGISLSIGEHETHILMGPNGSGKTTLLKAIMGLRGIEIEDGHILFDGEDITWKPPHVRARMGLAMMFQNPPRIKGVTLSDVIREIERRYGKPEDDLGNLVEISSLRNRSLHVGYSGGEIKQVEILLTILQKPRLALLDEPDSGVDVENLRRLGEAMNTMAERASLLIITHTGGILKYLRKVDKAHVIVEGRMICSGHSEEIIPLVLENGFDGISGREGCATG